MKPWAGIVRVSHMGTRHEGASDFHADRDQVEAVQRYAAQHGATVEFLPPELSVSGGRPINERPSLKAAIEGVEAGRYSGIVVAYLSRLTRSRSGLEIWDRVEAAGGHIHCAAENLDTSTPNGRFIRDVHLANAVREREEHAERFQSRRENAVAAGIWRQHQTPLGYTRDPDTRRLVPDDRADDVRWAFRARATGMPVIAIAQRLQMTPSGVRNLLRNRVYLGELHDSGHVNTDAHPALVADAEWRAAQSVRTARPPRSARREPALLAGLARCAGCGHVMSRGGGNTATSYTCHGTMSAGRCPAPATVTVRRLDALVVETALIRLDELRVRAAESTDNRAVALQRHADAVAELDAFIEATAAAGRVDAVRRGIETRQAAVDDAQRALDTLDLEVVRLPENIDPRAVWEQLSSVERRHLLGRLIECVMVRRAGRPGNVPLIPRVRVLRSGAGVAQVRVAGARMPIRTVEFASLNPELVLRMPAAEPVA